MRSRTRCCTRYALWCWIVASSLVALQVIGLTSAAWAQATQPEGEGFFFTPEGKTEPGKPVWLDADAQVPGGIAPLEINVIDIATGKPTFCRIAVVGADGQYYQPPRNYLSEYALTGDWPEKGAWGNRKDKAPFRYVGHFFYNWGKTTLHVPAGRLRIEVGKGFEFAPVTQVIDVRAGEKQSVTLKLKRQADMAARGWYSGDPHLHIPRQSPEDDALVLDLLEAEDIRFGSILGYNEPAGPYSGFMEKLAAPQQRGLGRKSTIERDGYFATSGQEYRNTTYGHILLFQRNELVFPGQDLNADNWPVYGVVARETIAQGGYAAYAHGGYKQEVYADVALGVLNAIELLQFGIYREVGLGDWYHMLNSGYRIPCLGASDWPACRWMGDCRTYAYIPERPGFPSWYKAIAQGESFMTTGPLLLLRVEGKRPGTVLEFTEVSRRKLAVDIDVACEVTPVQQVDLIVNGQVAREIPWKSLTSTDGSWRNDRFTIEVDGPSWIAARAWSKTRGGQPDAEAHTNPVYVDMGERRVFVKQSLDAWIERIDTQLVRHRQRTFPEKARVLDYFQKARDTLLNVREANGLRSQDNPAETSKSIFEEQAALDTDATIPFPTDEQLQAFLKPVPSKTPQEALQTFETVPGFEMQLVAAEPLVRDPVAAAFDESGNLYVCEMQDYPFKPAEGGHPLGGIALLKDTDQDGVFDTSTRFADNLLWAAGVVPYKGGVYVAAPPDIWYLRDNDGDGVADHKEKVFTGFGTGNQQGMVNNLVYGPDHKIYGSTAPNGGRIVRVDRPNDPGIDVTGRDFRFDPETREFESVTGTVQFGNTFDDFGRRFTCSESQPLLQEILPQQYLERNLWLPVPYALKNLAPGPVPVFRVSPVERWRQIRSARRVATAERSADAPGASHHVVDAAAGVTVYRGGAYPAEYVGTLFVGDGQNNLIHHRRLVPDGSTFQSERVEKGTEFVRSTDIWFRPVNFVNAPDGTLYCLDMNREVLESIHVPLDVARYLDFASGRTTGRIYRMAPHGFVSPAIKPLVQATGDELVAALESPNGWSRDTAARLICERHDVTLAAALEQIALRSNRPESRVAALWTLRRLGKLEREPILAALRHPHTGVRINGLKLADERLKNDGAFVSQVVAMVADTDRQVILQLAFTLGESKADPAVEALAHLAVKYGDDAWIRTAILSSIANSADRFLFALSANPDWCANGIGLNFCDAVAQLIGGRQHNTQSQAFLCLVATRFTKHPGLQRQLIRSYSLGVWRGGGVVVPDRVEHLGAREMVAQALNQADQGAVNLELAEAERVAAITLMATALDESRSSRLQSLVTATQPVSVQVAAIRALASRRDESLKSFFLDRFGQLTNDVQQEVVSAIFLNEDRILGYLERLEQGEFSANSLDAAQRERLLTHKSPLVRERAEAVLGARFATQRTEIVAKYQTLIADMKPDPEKGNKHFDRLCSGCHQLAGKGVAIGPNLASTASRDPQALVQHILNPNEYVLPNYMQYVIVDRAGKNHQGIIVSQTATSITLQADKNGAQTILRSEIDEMSNSGRSLMPEGFERDLSPTDLADLIGYLQSKAQADGNTTPDVRRVRDKGTLPGSLIERR